MKHKIVKFGKLVLLMLVAVVLLASPSFALTKNMAVVEAEWTPPGGGTPIQMWAFVETGTCPTTTPVTWSVGPKIVVPTSEGLTINLLNCLPDGSEPVSVVIPGQAMPDVGSGPVFVENRVRSFVQEAASNGGTQTYTWNSLQPGTYLYESGTHPQVQVQMGLYGAMTKNYDDGTGMAYSGVPYTQQRDLFYSEVDPALHAAVADGSYGTTGPTSTLNYVPKYFLLNGWNGSAWVDVSIDTGNIPPICIDSGIGQGDRLLLRMYNAGLRELAPMLLGAHFDLVAEGGRKYPFARTQYQTLLMPGSTQDAVFTPEYEANFKLIERRLNLTDAAATGGGMQTCITVAGVSNNAPVVTIVQPATDISVSEGTLITFEGSVTDVEDDDTTLTANLSWTSNLTGAFGTSGGPFSHTLSVGTHTVTASVTDSGGVSGFATRIVTVTGVTVPNVVGLSQTDAQTAIEAAELTVGTVTTQSSDTVPTGNVISQNPAAGASVPSGSAVDLVVSSGPAGSANTAPVVTITNPSTGATFTQIDSIPFSGTAIDAEDGDISANLSWTSDGSPIGSGASFSTTLPVGSHTIIASVTDSGGLPGSDSITVSIIAAASDTLTCKKADYKAGPDSLTIEVKSDDLPKGNRIITGVIEGGDPFNIPVKNPGSDVYRIVIQPYGSDPTGLSFTATSDLGGTCTRTVD